MKRQFTFEEIREFINQRYLDGMITEWERDFMLWELAGLVIDED